MLPNRGWKNKIVWFLVARRLLAFIIAILFRAHDQDGGSMITVYRALTEQHGELELYVLLEYDNHTRMGAISASKWFALNEEVHGKQRHELWARS